ncbi:DUF5685 family protein [Nocardiopsis alba]|uniref:DUF5685 family protein n=1 Tax=Nocardiopsis alba TaxID=53437 RepID=UPI00365701C1
MFGILRPCRHSLSDGLAEEWMSHLCGLCLALRDGHGQMSRMATNHDGLVVSVLATAQSRERSGSRMAGPCPLRGMRSARVAEGSGADLAATVSLMLASAKVRDHIEDGDGAFARPGVRAVAGRVARRWQQGARTSGEGLGFDGAALALVVDRQREVEREAGEGTDVLTVTAPTEEATAEAFAHTAILTDRPTNHAALHEAGRLFGRIAHLLDAVEDRKEDLEKGAWNPLTATGTGLDRARELCDDAVLGVSLALDEAEFTDDRLVRALLVTELGKAVDRTFSHAGYHGHPGHQGHPGQHGHPGHQGHPQGHPGHAHGPHQGHGAGGHHGHGHGAPGGHGHGGGPGHTGGGGGRRDKGHDESGGCCSGCSCSTPALESPPRRRGPLMGCAAALLMCCTCQFCCRDPHPGPWSGEPRRSWCDYCECCTCCNCCQCCSCCE